MHCLPIPFMSAMGSNVELLQCNDSLSQKNDHTYNTVVVVFENNHHPCNMPMYRSLQVPLGILMGL